MRPPSVRKYVSKSFQPTVRNMTVNVAPNVISISVWSLKTVSLNVKRTISTSVRPLSISLIQVLLPLKNLTLNYTTRYNVLNVLLLSKFLLTVEIPVRSRTVNIWIPRTLAPNV
jgi:hypothetical protein